jgi:hypothetical protein
MCPSGVVLWMGTFCVFCDCNSCECKCVRMIYIFVCVCSDWSELQKASILQAEGHTHNLSLCLAVLAFTMHLDSCSVSTLLSTQRFKSLLTKTLVFLFTCTANGNGPGDSAKNIIIIAAMEHKNGMWVAACVLRCAAGGVVMVEWQNA